MAKIARIPEDSRESFETLFSLDQTAYQQLLDALRNKTPYIYSVGYFDRLAPEVEGLTHQQVKSLVEVLFGMSIAYSANNVPLEQFVEDILDFLREEAQVKGSPSPDRFTGVVDKLVEILSLDVFKAGAKATNLLIEHPHHLTSARIFTELRPVFGEDVNAPPVGEIIIHTLKIEYREGEEGKEFYAAMDTRDLQILIDVFERAKQKTESLKTLLNSTGQTLIDFD